MQPCKAPSPTIAANVRDAIDGRLIQAFYAGGNNPGVGLASAWAPTTVAAIDDSQRMSLGAGPDLDPTSRDVVLPAYGQGLVYWNRAFGSWGQFDSNDNAATAQCNLGGFITGVDAGLGNGWRGGVVNGYMQSQIDVGARSSSANVNSYVLAGYFGGGY